MIKYLLVPISILLILAFDVASCGGCGGDDEGPYREPECVMLDCGDCAQMSNLDECNSVVANNNAAECQAFLVGLPGGECGKPE